MINKLKRKLVWQLRPELHVVCVKMSTKYVLTQKSPFGLILLTSSTSQPRSDWESYQEYAMLKNGKKKREEKEKK